MNMIVTGKIYLPEIGPLASLDLPYLQVADTNPVFSGLCISGVASGLPPQAPNLVITAPFGTNAAAPFAGSAAFWAGDLAALLEDLAPPLFANGFTAFLAERAVLV